MTAPTIRQRMESGEALSIVILTDDQGWLACLCANLHDDPEATGCGTGPHAALNALLDNPLRLTPAEQQMVRP